MLTVSDLELYPGFVMQEKEQVKLKIITLPLWSISLIGAVLILAASTGTHCLFKGNNLSVYLGVILWAAGGITGLVSFQKGGWITVTATVVQISIILCFDPWLKGTLFAWIAALPTLWIYYKRHAEMSKTAITALHLQWFAILWYIGLAAGLFIAGWEPR